MGSNLHASKRAAVRYAIVAIGCLSAGIAIGILVPTTQLRQWVAETIDGTGETAVEADTAQSPIFDVTLAAQKTMSLVLGKPTLGSYTQQVSVPAMVRERPAISNLQASSKLAGIVRKVYVDVGQSVREGDPLVELELTGEALAQGQAALLDSVKQLEIVRAEIARMTPIANSGGMARKNLLEKQYEEKRLLGKIEAKQQELLVGGFTAEQLDHVVEEGRLIRTIIVRVPSGIRPSTIPLESNQISLHVPPARQVTFAATAFSPSPDEDPWVYSIEKLNVSPGAVTQAGEALCDLAYHERLLLEGQAYERDVPLLTDLLRSNRGVSVSLGSDDEPEIQHGVRILYMDNHIDPATQTVRFYLELKNSVTSESQDQNGFLFRSWKYRPAQRGHILIPVQAWKDKLILPAEAVVQDGLDRVVFRHLDTHAHGDASDHSEFEMVPVTVLYQDRRVVVVDPTKSLSPKHTLALNNAYLLLMQMNQSQGGGNDHHGHDH